MGDSCKELESIPNDVVDPNVARNFLKRFKQLPEKYLKFMETNTPIGTGAFGKVYNVTSIQVQIRPAALKEIRIRTYDGGENDLNVLYEMKTMCKRVLGGMIEIFEIYTSETSYYILMELANDSLDRVMCKGTQTLAEKIDIMMQVSKALMCLHENNIVHGDIKPENVLLVGNKWKFADFGFAGEHPCGIASGTPGYMDPDIRGGIKVNDFRSDMYSLGRIMVRFFYREKSLNEQYPLIPPLLDLLLKCGDMRDVRPTAKETYLVLKASLDGKEKLSEELQDRLKQVSGGKQHNSKIKQSKLLVSYKGRNRRVWLGPRGKRYIKSGNQFIPL